MEKDMERFKVLSKLEQVYESAFTRKGMGKFMKIVWLNIKEEFSEEPNILELCIRLIIEELLFYAITVYGEKGYIKVKQLKEYQNAHIIFKPYKELVEYYDEYIKLLQKYFEKYPEKKSEIFDIKD